MKRKKSKRLRRITALVLCVSMLVTSLPAMAFAKTEEDAAKTTEVSREAVKETAPGLNWDTAMT